MKIDDKSMKIKEKSMEIDENHDKSVRSNENLRISTKIYEQILKSMKINHSVILKSLCGVSRWGHVITLITPEIPGNY